MSIEKVNLNIDGFQSKLVQPSSPRAVNVFWQKFVWEVYIEVYPEILISVRISPL